MDQMQEPPPQTSAKLLDELTWRKMLAAQVAGEIESHSRRHWRRYPAEGEVKAEFMVDDQPRKRTWDLLQIAAGGLTVRTGEEMMVNTQVLLHINMDGNPILARGLTRHCTQTLGGYKVGIKLLFEQP